MREKIGKISSIILCLLMVTMVFTVMGPINMIAEEPMEESDIPEDPGYEDGGWWVEGYGSYFEITESDYLNVVFISTESVNLYLESIPRVVNFYIEVDGLSTTTEITLSGFERNMEYYMYQDGNLREEFITDETGVHYFSQDISSDHHVFFQEIESTIYIRSDGSVDPPTAPISRVGDVYSLTDNIYEPIYIQKSGIALDGGGYTLLGPGTGWGIYVFKQSGITLKRLIISGFSDGIRLQSYSNDNILHNNSFSELLWTGINLLTAQQNAINDNTIVNCRGGINCHGGSHRNKLNRNTITNCGWGIWLRIASENILANNTASGVENYGGIYLDDGCYHNILNDNVAINNKIGIKLYRNSVNTLRRNVMTGNLYNFGVQNYETLSSQDIDTSNTVDGKPIYFLEGRSYETVPADAGFIAIVRSHHITVQGLTLSNNEEGIIFAETTDSIIQDVTITDCFIGIGMISSSNNQIRDNTVLRCEQQSLAMFCDTSNIVDRNTLSGDKWAIRMDRSTNNIISNNSILEEGNNIGISIVRVSYDNKIQDNIISGDGEIGIEVGDGWNILNNNTLSGYTTGIKLLYETCGILTNNEMIGTGIYSVSGNSIDTTNTVNGKPVYYLVDVVGGTVPLGAGQVILANCEGVLVENQDVNDGSIGILVIGSSNIDIKNNNASYNNLYGIHLTNFGSKYPNNILLDGNNASYNDLNGIDLYRSYTNDLSRNIVTGNGESGIKLESSHGILDSNSVSDNLQYGIHLKYSTGIELTNNVMINNGIYLEGYYENPIQTPLYEHWNSHSIDTSNTVNGKPIYYRMFDSGGTIPLGGGQIIMINCSSVVVENQDVSNASVGIYLAFSPENTITNCIISDNSNGIHLFHSEGNNVVDNTISNNEIGIYIQDVSSNSNINKNTISGNTVGILAGGWDSLYCSISENIIACNGVGIKQLGSHYSIITKNTISNNEDGLDLHYSSWNNINNNSITENSNNGISLGSSVGNTIRFNNISGNGNSGIYQSFSHNSVPSNIIDRNLFYNNGQYGIYWTSYNNQFYNNDFVDNPIQAFVDTDEENDFHLPVPIGGNFWDDFLDVDEDENGFYDNPYVFSGGQDDLPHVDPFFWVLIGPGVEVNPDPDVSLTFEDVLASGVTTVTKTTVNPGDDLANFKFLDTFYNITTTANIDGNITVCISYDDTGMTLDDEEKLRLRHWEDGTWVVVPSTVNTTTNVICGNVTSLSPFAIGYDVTPVEIDIKPGSDPNSINLGSEGNVPVAILTTDDFDATTVDPETVTLAGASVGLKGKSDKLMASVEDVDNDGDDDLMLHIDIEELDLVAGTTTAALFGFTFDDIEIKGIDSVNIVPP